MPSSRRFDVVLFDIGGVLTKLDFAAMEDVLRPDIDAGAWAQWMLQSGPARAFERGTASPTYFAEAAMAEFGAPYTTPSAVLAAFDSWLVGPFSGAVELIDETRGTGAAVGCLSNCNQVHAPRLGQMGLLPRFDPALLSHELGLAKPDPAIYWAASSRFGSRGAAVVFLDDNEANVLAGRKVGWTAIHVCGPNEARAALVAIGVLRG